jgi:hypothetical protein
MSCEKFVAGSNDSQGVVSAVGGPVPSPGEFFTASSFEEDQQGSFIESLVLPLQRK